MECRECQARLLEQEQLLLVRLAEDLLLLSLPESIKHFVRTMNYVLEGRETVVRCRCGARLGRMHPTGHRLIPSFSIGSVTLGGHFYGDLDCRNGKRKRRIKWGDVAAQLQPPLETIVCDDILCAGVGPEEAVEAEGGGPERGPLVFPSSDLEDYEWSGLTESRPRPYQEEAFVGGLLGDELVAIPTGLGKTMVALLLIARMRRLNPRHMGMILVDRIPLVYQHTEAVLSELHLRVATVSGGDLTTRKLQEIRSGSYEVISGTAGAVRNLLQSGKLRFEWFSVIVFDECHHASGGHVYAEILRELALQFPEGCLGTRPRLLGLSATLVGGKSFVEMMAQLREMRSLFFQAQIYYLPVSADKDLHIRFEGISMTGEQTRILDRLRHWILDLSPVPFMQGSGDSLGEEFCRDLYILRNNQSQLVLMLNSHDLEDLMKLIDIYEVVALLNLSLAVPVAGRLHNTVIRAELLRLLQAPQREEPQRVVLLRDALSTMNANSRCLVFTDRRIMAELLARMITDDLHRPAGFIIGHNGLMGMDWGTGQKQALERFNSGACQVLVSTSVVEEGLDVQTCDLVIRYSGVKNLIQFIQSGGRARRAHSQFVVFQPRSSGVTMESLLRTEENLHRAIISVQSTDRRDREQTAPRLLAQLRARAPRAPASVPEELDPLVFSGQTVVSEFSVEVFVPPPPNLEELEAALRGCFGAADAFSLSFVEVKSLVYSKLVDIFPTDWVYATVQLQSRLSAAFPTRLLDTLLRYLKYTLCFGGGHTLPLLLRSLPFHFSPDSLPRSHLHVRGSRGGFAVFLNLTHFSLQSSVEHFDLDVSAPTALAVSWAEYEMQLLRSSLILAEASVSASEVTLALFLDRCPLIYHRDSGSRLHLLSVVDPPADVARLVRSAGGSQALVLVFPRSAWLHVSSLFHPQLLTCPLFLMQLSAEPDAQWLEERPRFSREEMSHELMSTLWAIESLLSNRSQFFPLDFLPCLYDELQRILRTGRPVSLGAFRESLKLLSSTFFYDLGKEHYARLQSPECRRAAAAAADPAHQFNLSFLVKRVMWTPLRQVFMSEYHASGSRMSRRMSMELVMSVAFTTESDDPLSDPADVLAMQAFLRDGVDFYGVHFRFFLSSSSNLREHKAWFLAGDREHVLACRQNIIPNPRQFTSVAKYVTRLGLYGTMDQYIRDVPLSSLQEVPDCKAQDDDFLTDGCGFISERLSQEINRKFFAWDPCAYQFRYNGMKGMLLRARRVDDARPGLLLQFRPSMRKFDNQDEQFCVVKASGYRPVTLNHEIITILWGLSRAPAYRDRLKAYILNLQRRSVIDLFGSLRTRGSAIRRLGYHLRSDVVTKIASHFNLLQEPFWFRVLQRAYTLCLSKLRRKAKIPLSEGCLLFGVSDPTESVLGKDEVFVQVSDPRTHQNGVITGRVIVYRNPALYAGDLRVARAVDREELHCYKNVLIFPSRDCPHSLAACCSGGDLDGDQYSVIWDANLIPDDSLLQDPLKYSSLMDNAPQTTNPTDEEAIIHFFTDNVTNASLGKIANIHLAMCDMLDDGILNPICRDLAIQQSIAVDFPKTGKKPTIPREAKERIRLSGYPDFMEKPDKPSYESKQLLGVLYRDLAAQVQEVELLPVTVDRELLKGEGYRGLLEEVTPVLRCYWADVSGLKTNFGIQSEVDMFLGQCPRTGRERDQNKSQEAIAKTMSAIYNIYHQLYLDAVAGKPDDWRRDYTLAWYYLGYTNDLQTFSWVVWEELCALKPPLPRSADDDADILHSALGEALTDFYAEYARVQEQQAVCAHAARSLLDSCVGSFCAARGWPKGSFRLSPVGAFALDLQFESCPVQLSFLPSVGALRAPLGPPAEVLQPLLSGSVPSSMNAVAEGDEWRGLTRFYLESHLLPMLEGTVTKMTSCIDSPIPRLLCEVDCDGDSSPLEVGLSLREHALTAYMLDRLEEDPRLYPFLWVFSQWGDAQDLVKRGAAPHWAQQTPDGLDRLPPLEFLLLLLYLVNATTRRLHMPRLDGLAPLDRVAGVKHQFAANMHSAESQRQLGRLVDQFLSTTPKKLETIESFEVDELEIALPAEYRRSFSSSLRAASERLHRSHNYSLLLMPSLSDADSHAGLGPGQSLTYDRVLSDRMSREMHSSLHFHEMYLSRLSGAQVSLQPINGHLPLKVVAVGTGLSISQLKMELGRLAQSHGVMNRGSRGDYAEYSNPDSLQLLTRSGCSSGVDLKDFYCRCQPEHELRQRKQVLALLPPLRDWLTPMGVSVSLHVCRQLSNFPRGCADNIDALRVRMVFGRFYLLDCHAQSASVMAGYTVKNIEELIIQNGFRRVRRAEDSALSGATAPPGAAVAVVNSFQPERPAPSHESDRVGSLDLISREELQKNMTRRAPPRVGHGFTTAFFDSEELSRRQMTMYRESLESIGFREELEESVVAQKSAKRFMLDLHDVEGIHGNFSAVLDAEGRVISVHQRATRFSLSTLLLRERDNHQNDVRLHVLSSLSILQRDVDQLRQRYPELSSALPLSILQASDLSLRPEAVSPGLRRGAIEVSGVDEFHFYLRGSMLAIVRRGRRVTQGAPVPQTPRHFCELVVQVDCEPLRRYLREEEGQPSVQSFAMELLSAINDINEAIAKTKERLGMTLPTTEDLYC